MKLICDRSRILRPEVNDILATLDELRKEAAKQFFRREENQKMDFAGLVKRVAPKEAGEPADDRCRTPYVHPGMPRAKAVKDG